MRFAFAVLAAIAASSVLAQPAPRQIKDGIYVYTAKDQDSNVSFITTSEGLVMIDTGQSIEDARAAQSLARKFSAQGPRFIIHTEPHPDHTVGDYLFVPGALVMAAAGAGASIQQNKPPAEPGWKRVLPSIEYHDRMTLQMGDRPIELMYLKNVHSDADTAIWLPRERIVWAAASVGVKRFPNIRANVTIPDIVSAIRTMRSLNPDIVVPGHGAPGTTAIFDETERYYTLLTERVSKMVAGGRSLDQIKAELRMPEFDDWSAKDRFPTNVEAAYRAVKR